MRLPANLACAKNNGNEIRWPLKLKLKSWQRGQSRETIKFLQAFLSRAATTKKPLIDLLEETLPKAIVAHLVKKVENEVFATSLTCLFDNRSEQTIEFERPISLDSLSKGLGLPDGAVESSLNKTEERNRDELLDGFFEQTLDRMAELTMRRQKKRLASDPKRQEALVAWRLSLVQLRSSMALLEEANERTKRTVVEVLKPLATTNKRKRAMFFCSEGTANERANEDYEARKKHLALAEKTLLEAEQVEDVDHRDDGFRRTWKAKWHAFKAHLNEARPPSNPSNEANDERALHESSTWHTWQREHAVETKEAENRETEANKKRNDWMPPSSWIDEARQAVEEAETNEAIEYKAQDQNFATFEQAVLSGAKVDRGLLTSSCDVDLEDVEYKGWKAKAVGSLNVVMICGRYADTWDFEAPATLAWSDDKARAKIKALGFDLYEAKRLAKQIDNDLACLESEECYKAYKKSIGSRDEEDENEEEDRCQSELTNEHGLYFMDVECVRKAVDERTRGATCEAKASSVKKKRKKN